MSPPIDDLPPPPLVSSGISDEATVILVADLVESVVLLQADEAGLVAQFKAFVEEVVRVILPANAGQLVKSTGDGVIAEFDHASNAAAAAERMHAWMSAGAPLGNGLKVALRIGIHAAPVYRTSDDILGIGVSLASRISSIAGAGETVATPGVRDLLVDSFDASIEDLGDCYLRHVAEPVRLFRLGPAQRQGSVHAEGSYSAPLRAAIAVIPFKKTLGSKDFNALGDLVADSLIAQMSLSPEVRMVSRLSSQAFRNASGDLRTIAACLGVRSIVSGSYAIDGARITVIAEIADAATSDRIWTGRVQGNWQDLLTIESEIVRQLADEILRRLFETTASKALTHPLPTLKSYELFLGGVALMHRASSRDFHYSRALLEELADRHKRIALPKAWLAKWYVLAATQGALDDPARAASTALEHTRRALDLEPGSAFALAMEGFVHCHLRKDLQTGRDSLLAACEANASESLAWLFYAVLEAFAGNGTIAVEAGQRALSLSPMDPLRYYYESLMGSCSLAAGRIEDAIRWCESSRRRNRYHLSTLRILVTAYLECGREAEARTVAAELLRLRPNYSVAAYETQSVAALYPFGQRIARALREAGVP